MKTALKEIEHTKEGGSGEQKWKGAKLKGLIRVGLTKKVTLRQR